MSSFLLTNEPTLRLAVFVCVLAVMALLELWVPHRRSEIPRLLRWSNNLALVVIDTILLRLLFPVAAVGFASLMAAKGWGLFNLLDLPVIVTVILSLILFDLAIWCQHVVFHAVPGLWRLHRVHHADLEFDVTTGIRFHPVEILLSMLIKFVTIFLLGPPAIAVLLFEVVLNASSLFNHSNIKLPARLEGVLRLFIVTPDMHRTHHSSDMAETNSNYGFNLSWWDKLFGTYTAEPRRGRHGLEIGLESFRTRRDLWIDSMLLQPIKKARHTGRALEVEE